MKSKICLVSIILLYSLRGTCAGPGLFYNFKPKGVLAERVKILETLSQIRSQKSMASFHYNSKLRENDHILGKMLALKDFGDTGDFQTSQKNLITAPVPTITEKNPLYNRILSFLAPRYQAIGDDLSLNILKTNREFNLGTSNYSGFNWQKPMGNFIFGVDRQLAPDLFDDKRWIVTDKFVLGINAFTMLSNLKDLDLIDISTDQLALFAGLEFKREYTYVHFANSYQEGLTKEFNKLFLSFLKFRGDTISEMEPYEYVVKKDYFSTSAGGFVRIPLSVGGSASIAALVDKRTVSAVTINSLGQDDNPNKDEFLRIDFDKNASFEFVVEGSIEAEFFKLLRLTLLSYEYSYKLTDSEKIYLSFSADDKKTLEDPNHPLSVQVSKLLKLQEPDRDYLETRTVSRERRTKENKESKYLIALFGAMKKRETVQVKIQKDKIETSFFKNTSESIKYVKGVIPSLLNGITQMIFQVELFKAYKYSHHKRLKMEFKSERDVLAAKENLSLGKEKTSIVFAQHVTAGEFNGKVSSKFRKKITTFMQNFTSFDKTLIEGVQNQTLNGPFFVYFNARLGPKSLDYFEELSDSIVDSKISQLCSVKLVSQLKEACIRKLKKSKNDYFRAKNHSSDLSLFHLKTFFKNLNESISKKSDIVFFFGKENVFFHGNLKAKLKGTNSIYLTYFKDGAYQGPGVISQFKHNQQINPPIPIESY